MASSEQGIAERQVWRGHAGSTGDAIAVEEPLEIRVSGDTLAITMRTPGDDARLALGFLFAEGIIESLDDLGSISPCGRPGTEGYGNVIDAVAAGGVVLDVERAQASRRGTLTTAACGVCGRRSIDDLLALCPPFESDVKVERFFVSSALAQLSSRQPVFARTGGTHAAAAFDLHGDVLALHEDVGRHNAVDKVVGALLQKRSVGRNPVPNAARPILLGVSGRASFEIVQKAARARIPMVASISAASTLAIDLAQRAGVTLVGFVRGEKMNVYSHPERLI